MLVNIEYFIIGNVTFDNFFFTLNTIHKIEDNLVQIISYKQSFSDLFLLWIEMLFLIHHISKNRIILKKQWKIILNSFQNIK
jgi:hypothetical protein